MTTAKTLIMSWQTRWAVLSIILDHWHEDPNAGTTSDWVGGRLSMAPDSQRRPGRGGAAAPSCGTDGQQDSPFHHQHPDHDQAAARRDPLVAAALPPAAA